MNLLKLLIINLFGYVAFAQTCVRLPQNNCVTFTVGSGTGCNWICNYCANTLGTPNYYFTTPVCTYEAGGCVGNPVSGVSYTCCAAGKSVQRGISSL